MRARRTDENLTAIVEIARKLGFLVHVTNGDWDLTVQLVGVTQMWEVKRPGLPPSKRNTDVQVKLRKQGWEICRIETAEDVLKARDWILRGSKP